MAFWIVTGVMGLAVAAVIVLALLRGRGEMADTFEYDLAIYRDQLKEVDRDLERGVLTEEEAERLRTEVSRRILDIDRKAREARARGDQPRRGTGLVAVLAVLGIVGGAYGLYMGIGAPGYGDLPIAQRIAAAEEARQTRPPQAQAEAEAGAWATPQSLDPDYVALVDELRARVAERPEDLQGQRLLARNEALVGNFRAAYEAQERVIALLGDRVRGTDWADLADMMVLAAGGYVSPEAEAALARALRLDPSNGVARYYLGLMFAQTGRPDRAFDIWRALLESSAADDPWVPPVLAQVVQAAQLAGVDYVPPPLAPSAAPGRGPTEDDIAAAAEMDPEARAAMVQSMVAGLAERLATEGGPPADWARLIGAYGVLGETEAAAAIWAEAQQRFEGLDDALAQIRQAAVGAGVAE